jgi:hypothetical protein
MNPAHIFSPSSPNIHSDIILPSTLGLQSGVFPSGYPTKILYPILISAMLATCPANLILIDLIILIHLVKCTIYEAPHTEKQNYFNRMDTVNRNTNFSN